MRRAIVFVFLLPLALAACGSSTSELGIEASGLAAYEGKAVHTAVWGTEGTYTFVGRSDTTVRGGGFRVVAEVDADTAHRMDVYLDVDGDGACTPGVDLTGANDSVRTDDEVNHRVRPLVTSDPGNGCASWGAASFRILSTQLPDLGTRVLNYRLLDEAGRLLDLRGQIRLGVDVRFTGMATPGRTLLLALWIEDDDDTSCVGDTLYGLTLGPDFAPVDTDPDVLERDLTVIFPSDLPEDPSLCPIFSRL
jgi:hypothetical protein